MIRFHLDEHVPHAVALGLRGRGVDVTTSVEAGLLGSSDEDQIGYCLSAGRVLLTHDDDFLILHSKGVEHAGIAYCHQGKIGVGQLVKDLLLMASVLEPEEMAGQVEFL